MSGMTIRQEHLPEVRAALKRRATAIAPAFRLAGAQTRRLLVGLLTAYPAERPGQSYTRTQALKRGWERAAPIETGLSISLTNTVSHAGWVQGDQQAWMHVGRWQPARALVDAHTSEIDAFYRDALRKEVLES